MMYDNWYDIPYPRELGYGYRLGLAVGAIRP
jgi:hypothetical protein